MPTKARVGDIRSQVNDGLKPQEAGPDAKLTLTEGLTEHTALLTPGFQTAGVQNTERVNFYYFKPLSLWSLVTAAT